MNHKIPLFKIYWDKEDIKSITNVIKSGMYWAEGPSIEEFEDKIAQYIGIKHCVVFNTGTSALYAFLLAYGIKEGDEVIVPAFTFIATANAPLFVGARPVFADIEEETLGLDPEDVKKKITSRTKAIIAVHYGGCPCKIEELSKVAKEYNLVLLEDAAESFGARIKDRKVGTFGDAAIFSFCQNKIITTGEGGALVTNFTKIYKKLKLIRSHGRLEGSSYFLSSQPFDYITLGYNFRMPSYVAALGITQLKKIQKIINKRRKNAQYLTQRLNREMKEIITPDPPREYFHVYQMYSIRINRYRDELLRYLSKKGVMSKIYFPAVHLTHFYKSQVRPRCKLPVTEEISKQILSLPMYPTLTKQEMDYLLKWIRIFLNKRRRNERFL